MNAVISQRQHNEDRMRRARSWLAASEATDSSEQRFIFLWIAFNAAYGRALPGYEDNSERTKFQDFLGRITTLDTDRAIFDAVWMNYSGAIRLLLDNRYAYEPFWAFVRGEPMGRNWEARFEKANNRALALLAHPSDSAMQNVLMVIFSRLYTVRNQIVHGGTTFADGWGRDQLHNGTQIMAILVPAIVDIMQRHIEQHPNTDRWGRVSYPRVDEPPA